METIIYNQKGQEAGKIKLPESIFGLNWNADLVHQVVVSMQSSARTNVAHTKTRGEVRGGGKKPWQQKGTGRARHGSTRSPIWVGGGVAHGPRNDQNFDRKVNKKAKTKALFTILSRKMRDGEILFIDALSFAAPKTREAKGVISNLAQLKGFEKLATKPKNAALLAIDEKNVNLQKSFQNLGNIEISDLRSVNPVSLLNHKYLIITNPKVALTTLSAKVEAKAESKETK